MDTDEDGTPIPPNRPRDDEGESKYETDDPTTCTPEQNAETPEETQNKEEAYQNIETPDDTTNLVGTEHDIETPEETQNNVDLNQQDSQTINTPLNKVLARAKKRLRKRTALFSSPKTLFKSQRGIQCRISTLEGDIEGINDCLSETKDMIMSEMNDNTEKTKNYLKVMLNDKYSTTEETCNDIHERLKILEEKERKNHQVNLALKDRVNRLEKDMCILKKENEELRQQNISQRLPTYSSPNPSRESATNYISGEESGGEATDFTTLVARPSSGRPRTADLGDTTPVREALSKDKDNTHTQPDAPIRTLPSPGQRDHHLSMRQGEGRDQTYDTPSLVTQENHTHLIVGDSCIRGIKMPTGINTGNKVCISGLTVDSLRNALDNTPLNTSTKHILIHVGINDCKTKTITCEQWTELILVCKDRFPNANITMSAIIPAKSNKELRDKISISNTSLNNACRLTNSKFVPNEKIFLTDKGAPRQALYRDMIHPSPKGVARLAEHLFGINKQNLKTPPHYSMTEYPSLPKHQMKPYQEGSRPQPPKTSQFPPQTLVPSAPTAPTAPVALPHPQEQPLLPNQVENIPSEQHISSNQSHQYRYPHPSFRQPTLFPQMPQYQFPNFPNHILPPPLFGSYWPPYMPEYPQFLPQIPHSRLF